MLRLGDRRQGPVGGEPVEFVDAALQQVRPLDGQALGVVRAEDAGDSRREDLVRQFRLLLEPVGENLASRRSNSALMGASPPRSSMSITAPNRR